MPACRATRAGRGGSVRPWRVRSLSAVRRECSRGLARSTCGEMAAAAGLGAVAAILAGERAQSEQRRSQVGGREAGHLLPEQASKRE